MKPIKINQRGSVTLILLLFINFCSYHSAFALMKGVYTIDPSKPATVRNYNSISAALNDLANGIYGPVIFKIASGTYEENFVIQQKINGVSAKNTVTFQSADNDSTKVLIMGKANIASTVSLFNTKHIIFKKLTFSRRVAYSYLIEISGLCDSITFINNNFIGDQSKIIKYLFYSYSSSSSYPNRSILIKNNNFKYGETGIAISGIKDSNFTIEGNLIDSFVNIGILLDKHKIVNIKNNTISGGKFSSAAGISVSNHKNLLAITENKIFISSGKTGILLNNCNGDSTNYNLISNNIISLIAGSTATSGISIPTGNSYIDILYNNICINGLATNSYGLKIDGNYINVANNNLVNYAKGYVAGLTGTNNKWNYNNLFTTGSSFGTTATINIASFGSWKTNTGQDINSISVNPYFKSEKSLVAGNILLNGAAKPNKRILKDIEGKNRDTLSPDIGAHEFTKNINDAGIYIFKEIPGGLCSGDSASIRTYLVNYGSDTLKSVLIKWEINDSIQSPIPWAGALKPGDTISIILSKYIFKYHTSVKAWTQLPNLTTDSNTSNDTSYLEFYPALKGVFSIGKTNADFSTFSEAVRNFQNSGVCGPVVFNVQDGKYLEQIKISGIKGASKANTITFQSASGDSTRAILSFPSFNKPYLGAKDYTIHLDSASYLIFKKLTIERSGDELDAQVVLIERGSNYNSFLNNKIISVNPLGGMPRSGPIYSKNWDDHNNLFKNNLIKYGNYGIHLIGNIANSSNSTERKNLIEGNIIDSCYSGGIFLSNQDSAIVKNNIITNLIDPESAGITLRDGQKNCFVTGNKIILDNARIGIYAYPEGRLTISNNTIALKAKKPAKGLWGAQDPSRGIDVTSYTDSIILLYNNVYLYGSDTNSIVVLAMAGMRIWNNNFINMAKGHVLYIYNNGFKSDYNNLYTNGQCFSVKSTHYSNLANWKTTGRDINSISIDPGFISTKDVRATHPTLVGKGRPVANVKEDINGKLRSSKKTVIGAHEFAVFSNDAGILEDSSITGYCSGSHKLRLKIKNYGTTTIDSVEVHGQVNGITQTSYKWKGTLSSGSSVSVLPFTAALNTSIDKIKIWTVNPNSLIDSNAVNDSLLLIPQPGLSGNYTIGGQNPDFYTIGAAVKALNERGVCRAVIFNIRDGIYREQLIINDVRGTSSVNTVTFQSASGDSTKVIWTYPSSNSQSAPNYMLKIAGARHLNFKGITFTREGNNPYKLLVMLEDSVNNVGFYNNYFAGFGDNDYGVTSLNNYLIYSSNVRINNFSLKNNNFKDGYVGVHIVGIGTSKNINIENNLFNNCGIIGSNLQYLKVYKNIISGSLGISLAGIFNNFNVESNKITGRSGLEIKSCSGTTNTPGLVANNIISIVNGNGIYLYEGNNINVYHNSILVQGNNEPKALFHWYYDTPTPTFKILNNSFVNLGKGYSVYIMSNRANVPVAKMDYNNFYSEGGNLLYSYLKNVPNWWSLSGWQQFKGCDSNSVSLNPYFNNLSDIYPNNYKLNNIGTPVTQVPLDFNSNLRNTKTPDIGAYEFSPLSFNLSVFNVLTSLNNTCGDSNTAITLGILNKGKDTIKQFPVFAEINNGNTILLSDTFKIAIAPLTTDTIRFSNLLNTNSGGYYNFKIFTALPNEQDKDDDTLYTSLRFASAGIQVVLKDQTVCPGKPTQVVAIAPSGQDVFWYDSLINGNLLGKGDTLKISSAIHGKKYYAIASKGNKFNIIDKKPEEKYPRIMTGSVHTYPDGLFFDIKQPVRLDSISIYPKYSGNITLCLVDNKNKILNYKQLKIKVINPLDEVRIPVGFEIKPGSGYSLRIDSMGWNEFSYILIQDKNPDIYSINNIFQLLGVKTSSNNYYLQELWFFDWEFTLLTCQDKRSSAQLLAEPKFNFELKKASDFVGYFNNGTKSDPDQICIGGKASYNIFSNLPDSSFNKVWKINNIIIKDSKGKSVADTAVSLPSSTSPGKIVFQPDSNFTDSLVELRISASRITGCYDSIFSRYIKVNQLPKPKINGVNFICLKDTLSLSDTGTGGNTYFWLMDNGDTLIGKSVKYVYNKGGHYKILLKATSAYGCSDTISYHVFVDSLQPGLALKKATNFTGSFSDGTILKPDNICIGGQASYDIITSLPDSGFNKLWRINSILVKDSKGSTVTDTNFIKPTDSSLGKIIFSPKIGFSDSLVTLSVSISNINGCFDSTVIRYIKVNQLPEVKISTTSFACLKDTITFNSSGSSGALYIWAMGNGDTLIGKNIKYIYKSGGRYKVVLRVTNSAGCSDTVSHAIAIDALKFTASLTKASDFAGIFNNGTSINPDQICIGGKASYEINCNLADSNFSRTWQINRIIVKDSKGNPVTDTATVLPTVDSSGKIIFTPNSSYTDSIAILSLNISTVSGCYDSVITRIITVNKLPIVKISANKMICKGDTLTLSYAGTSAGTFSWNMGDGSTVLGKNIKHVYNKGGNYKVILEHTNLSGCKDTASHFVFVDTSCVWPGDANSDNTADATDLLAIGITYGKTGTERLNANILWQGQPGYNWIDTFANGTNYKHADCNGDSIIDYKDTLAIRANYNKVHKKTSLQKKGGPNDPDLFVKFDTDSVKAGDILIADIYLGTTAKPANDVYGLAFTIFFDTSLISASAIELDYPASFLGSKTNGMLTFSSNSFRQGQTDIALSRTNHINSAGYGKIASLKIPTSSSGITGSGNFRFFIGESKMISKDEIELPHNSIADSAVIYDKTNSVIENSIKEPLNVEVYPNPFNEQVFIKYRLQETSKVQIQVYDVLGKEISILKNISQQAGEYKLFVNANEYNMHPGIYFLRMVINNKPVIKRIVRVR